MFEILEPLAFIISVRSKGFPPGWRNRTPIHVGRYRRRNRSDTPVSQGDQHAAPVRRLSNGPRTFIGGRRRLECKPRIAPIADRRRSCRYGDNIPERIGKASAAQPTQATLGEQ